MAEGEIIIKRIKKGGAHGHHGGAWKVAYADFVTAMMAFFLLLWLINVTTPAQKMGLAEFFTPTMGVKDAMGIGFKGGKKPTPDVGRANTDMNAPGLVEGQIHQGPSPQAPDVSAPAKPDPDAENTSNGHKAKLEGTDSADGQDSDELKSAQQDIKQSLENDADIQSYKNNISMQDSPEGLKIDMIDDQKTPMFVPGQAVLTDTGKKVLDSMANILAKTPNNIAIIGHTDASGATASSQYTAWELSADRANAARRFLVTTQLEPERVQKVVGTADRDLLDPEHPNSPRNRRITIILLKGSFFRDPKSMNQGRALLSVPDAKVKPDEPKKEDIPQSAPAPKHTGPSIFDPITR